jgi:hypothetical protein
MLPDPFALPWMDVLLTFVVPFAILVVNAGFKRFVLGRGVELLGADLALSGFSILLAQTLSAVHGDRLPGDLIILTILALFVMAVLWFTAGYLVRDLDGYERWQWLASLGLGGVVFYSCIQYWELVRDLGYRWG